MAIMVVKCGGRHARRREQPIAHVSNHTQKQKECMENTVSLLKPQSLPLVTHVLQ